jgi:hypothetical protein
MGIKLGNGRNHSLRARNGANIAASHHGLGRTRAGKIYRSDTPDSRPSRTRWARRARPVRRLSKRRLRKATPPRPLRKKKDSKSKSNNLVCRCCGSADLARDPLTYEWDTKRGKTTFREIVRQQWSFGPQGSTSEIQDYQSQFRYHLDLRVGY